MSPQYTFLTPFKQSGGHNFLKHSKHSSLIVFCGLDGVLLIVGLVLR